MRPLPNVSSSDAGAVLNKMLVWAEVETDHLSFRECGEGESGQGTLGCFAGAGRDFVAGEIFFSVPQDKIFGIYQCQNTSLTMLLRDFALVNCKEPHLVTSELLIWLHMIEARADVSSDFHAYFVSLDDTSPSPLSWPDCLQQDALAGTMLQTFLCDVRASLQAHAIFVQSAGLDAEVYSYEALVWARGHYLARRYPGKYGIDGSVPDEGDGRESGLENLGVLVPVLDIINHDADEEWLQLRVSDDGKLDIICNQARPRGTQLYSNYGSLSNERLLFAYGFAIEDNPHDTFTFRMMARGQDATDLPKDLGTFYIGRGGMSGVPTELWKVLALLAGTTDEENQHEKGAEDELFEVSCDEVDALLQFATRKLSALTEADDDVTRALQRHNNSPLAGFVSAYREGQKLILRELCRDLNQSLQEATSDE